LSLVALPAAVAFGAVGVAVISACANATVQTPKPCDVQMVTLYIYAADNINPNDTGKPRPVVVRLYQLKNEVKLTNAQYDDVLLKDKEVLGEDVVKTDEVEVYPNDLVQVKFERNKDASVLGGVALFHGPKGQSWKTFYQFPLMPGEAQCAQRAGDAGKPQTDPQTAFFIDATKIDNGAEFDESMFPNVSPVREVNLPKGGAAPEGKGAAAPPAAGAAAK
jgi:type VI secretion system protein VasD